VSEAQTLRETPASSETHVDAQRDIDLQREVERFVYREAYLQDRHEYDAWEALWTDDGVYWIPANGDDIDPEREMSIIYDNRSRIALRIRQLHTGRRIAQEPKSNLVRVISNIEVIYRPATASANASANAGAADADIHVRANAIIFESTARRDTVWGTRCEYVLRRMDGTLRMARKKVMLVNNAKALPTLAFLI
jgi:3-phenylpropionate/cinnamic acid dioxygenase small subunit